MASVISFIQRLSFKLVNLLFGKTQIFIIIIGWYLVIAGLLFLVKPQKARDRLVSTGFGLVKMNILFICFFLWGILLKISQQLPGMVQAAVFWAGLAGLVIFFLKTRAMAKRKLASLGERLPMRLLIIFAWCQVVIGGLMIYLQRRLW